MHSILILSRWYPPHSGHFIRQIAQAISAYVNVFVLIIIPDPTTKILTFNIQYAEETEYCLKTLRISYHHLSQPFFLARLVNQIFYQLALIRGLMFYSRKKIKFDLNHIHVLTRTAIIPFFLKLFFRKPYLITEYWSRYLAENNDYHGWIRRKITSLIAQNAEAVVAISHYLKNAMEKNGIKNDHFLAIPPPINTQMLKPVNPVINPATKRFIHISTFSDRAKNINGILRTVKKLSERRSDFEFYMIGGETPFDAEAISFAKELDLYDRIVFSRGVKFEEELAREIQNSNFLVMFSNYETFSVVIQESLSCGKPVIATRIGPIPDLLDEDSGILVNPCDEIELLDALDFMLDHYQDYDHQQMHEKVLNSFGFNVVGKAYADLYESVLGKAIK
jgi:glycosyltransferase involved in cell wall biosynthesis